MRMPTACDSARQTTSWDDGDARDDDAERLDARGGDASSRDDDDARGVLAR